MGKWIETEIKDFLGINRSVSPNLNECFYAKNLDFRGQYKGELTNTPGYNELYTHPAHSGLTSPTDLGFVTFFLSQFDQANQKEVTLYVQKATWFRDRLFAHRQRGRSK